VGAFFWKLKLRNNNGEYAKGQLYADTTDNGCSDLYKQCGYTI